MAIGDFVTRDPGAIRDSILRVIRNGLIDRGIANPNVTPNSDWYVLASAVALQCAVVEANCAIKADALMPDTAVEEELARWAFQIQQLSEQAAAGSTGNIILESSAATTVASGSQLYDESGLHYEVSIGGVYADGASIPIFAVDTGTGTNHAEGDVLRWVSTPAFADEKALVGIGGLVNGVDQENDEALRARVLAFFQDPPRSGNWEHTNEFAEQSTSRVQKSFAYPAIQGPSTWHIAVTAAPTLSNKSRVVAAPTVSGVVSPFVTGKMPTHSDGTITSVTDVNVDVAFGLSLPEAPTANPPGLGGGWKDGTPWPSPDGVSTFRTRVTIATSDLKFTVDAATAPLVNTTHIAWVNPTTWLFYRALVVLVTGAPGAYEITLDAPFTGISVGSLIWPDCEKAEAYVAAALGSFALMGPGEKSSNATALVRGFRHPPPNVAWPYALGPILLRAITDAGSEVQDTQYLHRTDGVVTLTGSSLQLKPQIPAAVTDPPKQFIPRHIAMYRSP